ncbi:MAG: AraC family transcriptional regulator [Mucilaginibacter sp.]
MKYAEYHPKDPLKKFIDAYYVLETDALYKPVARRVFADGCTEIFINIGTSTPHVNLFTPLSPGNIYLGGTMTIANIVSSVPNSTFVGIRFKPAGFSAFYNLPVDKIVDQIIEFPDKELMAIIDLDDQLVERLDKFFQAKLRNSTASIIPIAETIDRHKGLVSVDFIASKHNVSIRTLERVFGRTIGIPPKEFIKIIRFQYAHKRLLKNNSGESLLSIACEMGYYDHSHLARDIKKYSGLNPSEIKR